VSAAQHPDDAEIIDALGDELCGEAISSVVRRPYRYATSFPLEELEVRLQGGRSATLILKDLTWNRLPQQARLGKPAFLYEPLREIVTYEQILRPLELGPRCFAAHHDPAGSGSWLVLEKVRGVELWQIGDVSAWVRAARWAARLHARLPATDAVELNPYLLNFDTEWFLAWAARARANLSGSADSSADQLIDLLEQYDPIAEALSELPKAFVHGEYFPSNILVDPDGEETFVWPVDWEMAGVGPCMLDAAALLTGWDRAVQEQLLDAYRAEISAQGLDVGTMGDLFDAVRVCQLHFAVQWLGWSPQWTPPSEHARDWLSDALDAARDLGLT
jgi:hypothetical protein